MVALVQYIAAAIVDAPHAVRVREVRGARGAKIELHVAPDDLGKVIGRGGRTARALRALISASGRKQRRSYTLEIGE